MKEEAIKHLEVLDLKPGAGFKDVKNSYKLLSMAWHPDRFSNEKHKTKAEVKQKQINSAYHWLKNNKEALTQLTENSAKQDSKQKVDSNTKSKKQSSRTTYHRKNKFSYNGCVKNDGKFLKFEDKKYDINLIERAFLNISSKKYIRGVGYILFLLGWIFVIATIVAFFNESDDTGLIFILLFFLSFIAAPFFVLFKDIVKIDIILKNKAIDTAISYKIFPNTSDAEKKYKIAKNLVNEINDAIASK